MHFVHKMEKTNVKWAQNGLNNRYTSKITWLLDRLVGAIYDGGYLWRYFSGSANGAIYVDGGNYFWGATAFFGGGHYF